MIAENAVREGVLLGSMPQISIPTRRKVAVTTVIGAVGLDQLALRALRSSAFHGSWEEGRGTRHLAPRIIIGSTIVARAALLAAHAFYYKSTAVRATTASGSRMSAGDRCMWRFHALRVWFGICRGARHACRAAHLRSSWRRRHCPQRALCTRLAKLPTLCRRTRPDLGVPLAVRLQASNSGREILSGDKERIAEA